MSIETENETIRIEKLSLGSFGTNCYILTCRKSGDSLLVDTPAEASKILAALEGTKPRYIVITHDHMDHLGAFAEVRSGLGVPVAVHPMDAKGLPAKPEISLSDGDTISFGEIDLKVLHTPGHTPGSICLLWDKYLISGDTLFPGGPGKTKSPENLRQIIDSLKNKIFVLPEETQIYPGHGESTTVGTGIAEFQFFSSRPHDPNLCGDVLWRSS